MSLKFLPWPIFVLLTVSMAVVFLTYLIKDARLHTKTMKVGLILASIGSLMFATYKITSHIDMLNQYTNLIEVVSSILSIVGIILMIIGSYNNIKFDQEKKRSFMITIFILLALILSLIGIILFLVITR